MAKTLLEEEQDKQKPADPMGSVLPPVPAPTQTATETKVAGALPPVPPPNDPVGTTKNVTPTTPPVSIAPASSTPPIAPNATKASTLPLPLGWSQSADGTYRHSTYVDGQAGLSADAAKNLWIQQGSLTPDGQLTDVAKKQLSTGKPDGWLTMDVPTPTPAVPVLPPVPPPAAMASAPSVTPTAAVAPQASAPSIPALPFIPMTPAPVAPTAPAPVALPVPATPPVSIAPTPAITQVPQNPVSTSATPATETRQASAPVLPPVPPPAATPANTPTAPLYGMDAAVANQTAAKSALDAALAQQNTLPTDAMPKYTLPAGMNADQAEAAGNASYNYLNSIKDNPNATLDLSKVSLANGPQEVQGKWYVPGQEAEYAKAFLDNAHAVNSASRDYLMADPKYAQLTNAPINGNPNPAPAASEMMGSNTPITPTAPQVIPQLPVLPPVPPPTGVAQESNQSGALPITNALPPVPAPGTSNPTPLPPAPPTGNAQPLPLPTGTQTTPQTSGVTPPQFTPVPDLFTPGEASLKEKMGIEQKDLERQLREQMAARGINGSSIDVMGEGDILGRLQSEYNSGIQSLAGQQASLALQQNAQALQRYGIDSSTALQYAQLWSDAGFRQKALDLQAQGMSFDQALQQASQTFQQGYADRSLNQSGQIANTQNLLDFYNLIYGMYSQLTPDQQAALGVPQIPGITPTTGTTNTSNLGPFSGTVEEYFKNHPLSV